MTHPLIADLAAERHRRGLSMTAAGERAGINAATISRWESGQRQPCLPELSAYAMALGYALTLTPVEGP